MKSRIPLLSFAIIAALLAAPVAAQKNKDAAAPTPLGVAASAPAEAWRPLDPENVLLLELPAGKVVIEMRPDFAPQHVARIKQLAREGFYNGLHFHRVIEGFVAQGGDPKGDGTGGSELPDLPAEFARDASAVEGFVELGRDRMAARVGYIDGMPVAAQPETLRSFRADKRVELWGVHCAGVMSMARSGAPDSANSQFFLMLGEARGSLDRRYTPWGWIVDGHEASRRIERGEPPNRPTPIVRMRVMADIPEKDRPKVEVLRTDSESYRQFVEASGTVNEGLVRDVCNLKPPRRINGELIEL